MFYFIDRLHSKSLLAIAPVAFTFATLLSGSANAVQVINFPDVNTPHLVYSSLQESNNSSTIGQSLFAGISNMGDNLVLQSTAFSLSSVGGVDFLTGDLDVTITANPGQLINSISIVENGSATTFGVGSTTYAYLDSTIVLDNSPDQQGDDSYTKVGPAPPSSSMYNLAVNFSFTPEKEVLLTVRNDLLVDGAPGVASIGKDRVRIIVGTTAVVIPEPTSALALLVFGIVGTSVRRRR
jgi:hypothetical protein